MKYIKSYYDRMDYKSILNHFFRLFVNENFLNISENDYYNIFNDSINKIINNIENKNIKSDKKFFYAIRNEILFLIDNNIILNNEIEKKNYIKVFKSDEYYILNSINYNFFRLMYY